MLYTGSGSDEIGRFIKCDDGYKIRMNNDALLKVSRTSKR